jgi:hypothetical protein
VVEEDLVEDPLEGEDSEAEARLVVEVLEEVPVLVVALVEVFGVDPLIVLVPLEELELKEPSTVLLQVHIPILTPVLI